MKTLISDFVWSAIVVILLWFCVWIASSQAYEQPEYLYESKPNSDRADIFKPRCNQIGHNFAPFHAKGIPLSRLHGQ